MITECGKYVTCWVGYDWLLSRLQFQDIILYFMGNQTSNKTSKENANVDGHKVFLSLRCRDIILHYSYKMKLTITDISLFPHGLQGLRLWDQDVILSRYVILQNEKFKNKSAFVFKGGVGIVGIALSKWGGCKKIDMCDTRPEVVGNMTKNCLRNQIKNVKCFEVNLAEFGKYSETYDFALATDLFSQGFQPHVILNIWRKVLKIGGESIMLMPDKKDQCRRLLEIVDRTEFKIQNMLLTADQYEASPLLNKQEGESEFPQIGKTNFYVISLTKLREKSIAEIKAEQQELNQNKKAVNKDEQKPDVVQQEKKVIKPKEVIMREQIRQEKSLPVNPKQQKKQIPQQKPVQVQEKVEKKENVEAVKEQIKKRPQSSQKKQGEAQKKTQIIKQEEKMLQMEQEKKMIEMEEQKKMIQMAQQKKMLQIEEQKKMLQMQEQKRMLEMAAEKEAAKNKSEQKTQQIQQENKVQETHQSSKEQKSKQEQPAEVTQPLNVQPQKQQQTETKEQAKVQAQAQVPEQQVKQQVQQQPKSQEKSEENMPQPVISTEKAEPEEEAKEEAPAQNIQYNINEEEIVYDGYVPSQDQKNQLKPQQMKETNQQQSQASVQIQNGHESNQVAVEQKQLQEHKQTKQTNPQAL